MAIWSTVMEQNRMKSELSIKPLLKYLKQIKAKQDPAIAEDVDFLPNSENDPLPQHNLHNSKLREAIVKILDYVLKKDKDNCWAITSPLSAEFYYISEPLSAILNSGRNQQYNLSKLASSLPYTELCYRYILEEFYNYTSPIVPELVHEIKSDKPQFSKFFQITEDNRFVEVSSDIPMPDIDTNSIDFTDPECPEILKLEKLLPLSKVQAEGFSILNFKDVIMAHSN
jgi:hypothetical protein